MLNTNSYITFITVEWYQDKTMQQFSVALSWSDCLLSDGLDNTEESFVCLCYKQVVKWPRARCISDHLGNTIPHTINKMCKYCAFGTGEKAHVKQYSSRVRWEWQLTLGTISHQILQSAHLQFDSKFEIAFCSIWSGRLFAVHFVLYEMKCYHKIYCNYSHFITITQFLAYISVCSSVKYNAALAYMCNPQ